MIELNGQITVKKLYGKHTMGVVDLDGQLSVKKLCGIVPAHEIPRFPGDYTGTSQPMGYAWCLGKAVPVYNVHGLVKNPQFVRYYLDELPQISTSNYSSGRNGGNYIDKLSEADYRDIMGKGAFLRVQDFPCLSIFHLLGSEYYTPFGVCTGVSSSDFKIRSLRASSVQVTYPEYFDMYITKNEYESYISTSDCMAFALRYKGQDSFSHSSTVGNYVYATASGERLEVPNIDKYLLLTQAPYKA